MTTRSLEALIRRMARATPATAQVAPARALTTGLLEPHQRLARPTRAPVARRPPAVRASALHPAHHTTHRHSACRNPEAPTHRRGVRLRGTRTARAHCATSSAAPSPTRTATSCAPTSTTRTAAKRAAAFPLDRVYLSRP